ncbi:MAG: hypothetical protein JRH20_15265 [Deltaproteobacteria bacterium]|nr:hypothetical protein [Deltaproteobacteria bacterium]
MTAYTWRGTATAPTPSTTSDDMSATPLGDMTENFTGEQTLGAADNLTLRVRAVMIREHEDWAHKNDLIIATTFQVDRAPAVRRLHFLKDNVPLGWQEDFFNDVILSQRDFTGKTVTIRVQVYDMDGIDSKLIAGVEAAAQSAAVALPALAPYAAAVGFAVPAFLKLANSLDDHDQIFDKRLKLEVQPAGTRHKLLQPGYYVGFRLPVEDGWKLRSDLRVVDADNNEYDAGSYVVLEVARQFLPHPEREIDQKIATLLAELDGKGQSGRAPLSFLRDTLDGYARFKKLERAQQLRAKSQQEGQTLSPAEQQLFDELSADASLTSYMPWVGTTDT